MNIDSLLEESVALFERCKIENPLLNAGCLLEEVTGIKRLMLNLFLDKEIAEEQVILFREWCKRRSEYEPIQYIIGYTEFLDYKLYVTPDVLIPRPETEYLVYHIKRSYTSNYPKRILDIGAGSGAISIALKSIFPLAEVIGVDISDNALEIAKKNATLNSVDVKFIKADIINSDMGSFDLIVSNPPYVTEAEYQKVPLEVMEYEPKLALVGEENGTYFYRRILELSREHLNKDGKIFFEIGEFQAEDITKLARVNGYSEVEVLQDLVEKDRIVKINKSYNHNK